MAESMKQRMARVRSFIGKKRGVRKNAKKKRASRSRFKHVHIASPSKFAKGSIRTIKSGKAEIRVGCPKGKYSKKTRRCKVGTRAVSILKPNPRGKTFRVFARKGTKYYYWTGEKFDTNYHISHRLHKDAAIRAARVFARKYPQHVFGVSDGKA